MKKSLPGLLMGLVMLLTTSLGFWENAELYIYDTWFSLHGRQDPSPDIVIIGMDEKSISGLGPLPWPREIHAQLLQKLGQARVVAFDVLFDMPKSKAGDGQLVAAVKSQGHVVLSTMFVYEKDKQENIIASIKPPFPELAEASSGAGFINMASDKGNTVRKVALFYPFARGQIHPSLGLAAYLSSKGINAEQLKVANGRLKGPGLDVALENANQAYPNFWGPGGTYPTYSYNDVLQGRIAPESFKDKIVLIGTTTPEAKDYLENPYTRGNMLMTGALPLPGVEIHASLVNSLLNSSFFHRASSFVNWGGFLLAFILAMLASRSSSPWKAFFLILGLALFLSVTAYFSWLKMHYWLNLAAPLLIVGSVYTANTVDTIVRTNLEKRRIRSIFSRYVSPTLVEKLIDQDEEIELGGLRLNVTVLFADIRGFTAFSEGKPAEKVVARLNEFFTSMTEIIFANGGTLDKYLGDGIMAYFGAPLPQPDHAERALLTAVQMLKKVDELNRDWQLRGEAPMEIGLGINTGNAVVGNIGSPKRMEYTVIGDEVNRASRLETLNKEYKTSVILGEETFKQIPAVPEGWRAKHLGEVAIRGLSSLVNIYTLERTSVNP